MKFVSHHECAFVYYGEVGAQFANGQFETEDEAIIKYLLSRPEVEAVEEEAKQKKDAKK